MKQNETKQKNTSKKKKKKKKIEESVKLTPNTVFSGLGDTEGFF